MIIWRQRNVKGGPIKKRRSLPKRLTLKRKVGKRTRGKHSLYNKGYNDGYQEAMNKFGQPQGDDGHGAAYEKAYKNGLYAGGEGVVDALLPGLDILPDFTAAQIIEAGIEQLRPYFYTLLGAPEVAERIIQALHTKTPLSVVRLGDGELLTLAQDVVMGIEQVRQEGHFLAYAGIDVPDYAAREQLAQAVRVADIVGVPKVRLPNFQPLAFASFRAHGIDYRQLCLTVSTINYSLHTEGYLPSILSGQRVLVVGNSAPGLAQQLANSNVHVVGIVSPVDGVNDIPHVMAAVSQYEFDLALIGAGIPAVIIAQRIASELGKVAIDFGHLANSFVKGEAAL